MRAKAFPLYRPFAISATIHPSSPPSSPPPPPPPPPPSAASIADLVLTSNPQTLSKTLLNFHWSELLVNQTLKRLWNHGPKALQFFNTLDQHARFSLPLSSFHHAIDIAGRLKDYDHLWSLVDRLKSRRLGPTLKTFAIIIERYVTSGKKPDKAVKIFLSMHKHGCPQDLIFFNTLLDILCKAKRVETAHDLLKVFRGRFGVDVVSYNTIANGWCLVKRTPKALEVLKEMVERGLDPTLSSYNIMLRGYFRTGQTAEAWRFFLEMKKRNCGVDVVSYTTLIHGFGVAGEVDKARKLFDEMVREGVLPNVSTYNALIQVLFRKESVESAVVLFKEMVGKGYVPNVVTYNVVIRGHCHVGDMDRALEYVGLMRNDGCEPNVQTYNLLIRYFCDAGEIEKGLNVFSGMGCEECLPNLDTYNVLINSMFVRQKPEDLVAAGRLLVEMVDRGFIPTKFTFNRVLNGLLVTGNQAFAREILQLLSGCGFLPRNFRL